MQLITPEGFIYSMAAPNTEEHSSTGDAFTRTRIFHRLEQSQAIAQAAQWALRQVTRYEQLRPWDKELIRWRSKSAPGARSIAPVSQPIG